MLFLLSPAKALDYETPVPAHLPHTLPEFARAAAELVAVLRQYSPQQIAQLMGLSDALAALNTARYAAWSSRFSAANSRQAVLAFDGDVYGGLSARTLTPAQLDWAQEHLCILSGLYGVLRPLDWMQPYRLEMGTRLTTSRGGNLYQFWGQRITEHLNQRLKSSQPPAAAIVNLASQEYFKSVDRKALQAPVIDCVFEDYRAGQYKVISVLAKRARGLMARHAVACQARTAEQLQAFDLEGYAFAASASEPGRRLVFRRKR
ncbi:MAG: peroxide stress protein YaaA [Burkholderiaceae bacterium]|jgi:cytoplasmic iron level regulating protein YaaA (DUF328/UPF0246 family)|nr:peroxide stress protein YaaA [Burkholderiaceae bacterium]